MGKDCIRTDEKGEVEYGKRRTGRTTSGDVNVNGSYVNWFLDYLDRVRTKSLESNIRRISLSTKTVSRILSVN